MRFGEKCYKVKLNERAPQAHAREKCIHMGADLVCVDSPGRQEFLVDYISQQHQKSDYWIGEPSINYSILNYTLLVNSDVLMIKQKIIYE